MSDLVIVGEVLGGWSVLNPSHMSISTISEVRVLEVINGKAAGGTIRVTSPGGRVEFADGSTARIQTPGFEGLTPGRQYVLVLEHVERFYSPLYRSIEASNSLVPKLGPQGVFELTADGVRPQGRDSEPLKQLHAGEPVGAFVARLRREAR